jgi:hypothetical protein
MYLLNVLLETIFQCEGAGLGDSLATWHDIVLIEVIVVVDWLRAENTIHANHDGLVEHAYPLDWVEVVRAVLMASPAPGILERLWTNSTMVAPQIASLITTRGSVWRGSGACLATGLKSRGMPPFPLAT